MTTAWKIFLLIGMILLGLALFGIAAVGAVEVVPKFIRLFSLLVLFERGPFPHPAGQHVLVAFLLRLSALVSGRMPPRRFAFAGEGDLCGNDLLGVGAVSKINKAQGVLPASGAMSLVPSTISPTSCTARQVTPMVCMRAGRHTQASRSRGANARCF